MRHDPGIGATPDLNLRVSVATLTRVVFIHPTNGDWMLALERKATVRQTEKGQAVKVRSQPFGGAIRILDLKALQDLIGDFNFDSQHSRFEQDFRIFIRPASWPQLRAFCIQHLNQVNDPVLETDPIRELAEEFADALQIHLESEQYRSRPLTTIEENSATPTENIHARGYPTVRIYRTFEVTIIDSSLVDRMLNQGEGLSNQQLCQLALEDARNGGKGRANAVLALPLKRVQGAYQAIPSHEPPALMRFEDDLLDYSVLAILDDLNAHYYQEWRPDL